MTGAMPAIVDLQAYRGDTWEQQFRLLDGGAPVDLSDASVACWAKNGNGADAVHLDAVVESDPGVVTIALPLGMRAGRYEYDLEVTGADSEVMTWIRGRLLLHQDVTNAA